MRDNTNGRQVHVMTISIFVVLFGSQALPALCRPQLHEIGNSTANSNKSTSLYDSKVIIIFCVAAECNYFGHGLQYCACCGDITNPKNCYQTMKECRAKCRPCNPKCSPSSPL
ncbi:hypothetical protein BDA96_01G219200 [Sorghum bicolor]|uniref:Embryo surrounding factor 1 brassicaceae domain-containing protein n=2 Tax=Sorghum bicolor TaxID=4558 RepID=A0A921UZD2_SORBI|nr:hypothetical protein BDA96_01G219200 [Sorghum bicolor]OQU91566.1 hypothetical protein SORBI_3001G205950 [Sorghum bicolor]